jgi:hypothetical protein
VLKLQAFLVRYSIYCGMMSASEEMATSCGLSGIHKNATITV